MALLWGGSGTEHELAQLRRRVALLEQQVDRLARFSGMDPTALPQRAEVLGDEAQRLALRGQKVAAVKAHREQTHVDLRTAVQDVESFVAEHKAV